VSRDVELLVIGGGPAGSVLATLAAREGCSVRLVERASFPRDKVCGEFVSAEGRQVLERLGVTDDLDRRGALRADCCRISDAAGRTIDAPLPRLRDGSRAAMGISREVMDHTLLQYARRAGVDVLEAHEAVEPIFQDGRVRGVSVRRVGAEHERVPMRAALVVAADGRRSLLARALHPRRCDPRRTRPASWFGLKTHLAGGAGAVAGRVELHLFDGGYVGLAAVEDDRVNVCLMTRVSTLREHGGSPERLLRERVVGNPAAARVIECGGSSGRWHTIGPLRWGVRRPAAAGALFVGDAAGTIDPFAGEGMSNAMRAAELAVPFVTAAVGAGGLSPADSREYERVWQRTFGPVTRRVRRIGRLFERPLLARPVLGWLAGSGAGWLPRLVASTRTGS
jgi:flavin-dependent dehydrogenase